MLNCLLSRPRPQVVFERNHHNTSQRQTLSIAQPRGGFSAAVPELANNLTKKSGLFHVFFFLLFFYMSHVIANFHTHTTYNQCT